VIWIQFEIYLFYLKSFQITNIFDTMYNVIAGDRRH